MKYQIIAIVGPTATGKSDLARLLALDIKTEVISADSRLVYNDMNIGTAKPPTKELSNPIHHLVNHINPTDYYSLVNYLNDTRPVLDSLINKYNSAIIAGGTGLYFRGLLEGMPLTNVPRDPQYRESLEKIETHELYKKLNKTDSIDPNNRGRIIRALEIEKSNGYGTEESIPNKHKTLWIGLDYEDRDHLRERILKRTHIMLDRGLLEETESLLEKYGELELFHKTIGYHECILYLNNEIKSQEELIEKIYFSTCQYAKRQRTWFKANKEINWIDPSSYNSKEDLVKYVQKKFL